MCELMTCVHRWRLTEPNGPMADGKCSVCGEVRTSSFRNSELDPGQWKEIEAEKRKRKNRPIIRPRESGTVSGKAY